MSFFVIRGRSDEISSRFCERPGPCRMNIRWTTSGARWSCATAGKALAGHLRLSCWQRREREGEGGAPARIVCDAHTATVRSHGFADDSETKAGAFVPLPGAAPEPFENVLAILWRHAAAVISHFNPTRAFDCDGHLRSIRGVQDGVLDQISERIFERVSVSVDLHRLLGADKCNGPLLSDRPRRHRSHNGGCDLVEIDSAEFERDRIQPGDA